MQRNCRQTHLSGLIYFSYGRKIMNYKNDKEDRITNDADKSLVPVIITIVIGRVLLAILACVIVIKISDVTPASGPL